MHIFSRLLRRTIEFFVVLQASCLNISCFAMASTNKFFKQIGVTNNCIRQYCAHWDYKRSYV